jgi:type IV pilus assembly protein PilF
MVKARVKKILSLLHMLTFLIAVLLSGCVTQSFEDNEPVVKTQANRDEMAATRISLGLGYLKMGDMSQAKLNLEKAKRFSPNLVQVHTAFAHYYETVGENDLAITSFEEALTIKSDSADTLNNYGVFLCRQNKVDAAEAQFLKAIAVPSYLLVAQSYENLASCYLQNDNFEKAEMYLNKTIAHNPNRTSPLLQMVRLKYAMGNYKEARVYLQKFERNTQRFSADSLALSYKVYRKLGQRRTANNYGNMLVKMYPQSWEGKQFLLNGLEFIEADNLANKYQLSQKQKTPQLASTSKKRVVKLSPKSKRNNKSIESMPSEVTSAKTDNSDISNKLTKANSIANSDAEKNTQMILLSDTAIKAPGTEAQSAAPKGSVTSTSSGAIPSIEAPTTVNKTPSLAAAAITVSSVVNNRDSENTKSEVQNEPLLSNDINESTDSSVKLSKEQPETLLITDEPSKEVLSSIVAIEPTSTQPIPAERDAPLPEALPPIKEVIISNDIIDTEIIASSRLKSLEQTDSTMDDITFHKVSAGENLYNISVKYNTKISTLRKWNNISEKNTIRTNQKLYVVDPDTVKNINE